MKVAIVTTEDLFYVRHFFTKFFPLANDSTYSLEGITILPAFKKSTFGLVKQMWGFYGPYYFLLTGVKYVWRKITQQTVETLAVSMHIPIVAEESVNSKHYIDWLKRNQIDVVVSIASPELFKTELLSTVPKGCINSHSALLPENRGMMPVFWALYKGSGELGVTIHTMEEKLDSGKIFKQEIVPNNGESLNAMILKTKEISARLIHEVLTEMSENKSILTPMAPGGSYQTFPTPQQVKEFLQRGNRLF